MIIECLRLAALNQTDNSHMKMPSKFASSVFFVISSNQNGKNQSRKLIFVQNPVEG